MAGAQASFFLPVILHTCVHHYLASTEHLLLGLLREEEGLASQVLLKSGVTLEKARELVKQLLAMEQTTSAPESEQYGEP